MSDDVRSEIRAALEERRLVPVIGVGVSRAAAGLPTWWQAVDAARQHLERTNAVDAGELAEAARLLDAGDLVAAAALLTGRLKDLREWGAWLRRAFRVERGAVHDWRLPSAVFELMCPLLATTNYDPILSFDSLVPREAVSWDRPASMQAALRDSGGVLHLHGVWDKPDTVVFGTADYDRLAADEAYESVMRTLWLDRTLLFVGCSFDGMQDPDVGRLLAWAGKTFGQSQFRHYALLPTAECVPERVAHLLRQRIQVIDYGPDPGTLPDFLRSLNPGLRAARIAAVTRAREIVELHDPGDKDLLAQLFDQVMPREHRTITAADAAAQVLTDRSASAERRRQELFQLQQVAGSMVDRAAMHWVAFELDRRRTLDEENRPRFRATAVRVWSAWQLFPKPLLDALHQRGVQIHRGFLESSLGYFVRQVVITADESGERLGDPDNPDPLDKPYTVENVQRLASSLESVLAADPYTVFPVPAAGLGSVPAGPAVIVARGDQAELRAADNLAVRSAALRAGTGDLRRVEAVAWRGKTYLTGYSPSAAYLWEPRVSLEPARIFESADGGRVKSVAHVVQDDTLHTFVLTERTIEYLVDFDLRNALALGYNNLAEVAALPGPSFVLHDVDDGDRLRGERGTQLTTDQVLAFLAACETGPDPTSVHIGDIHAGSMAGRAVLCVTILIDRRAGDGYDYQSGVLLAELLGERLTPFAFLPLPVENACSVRLQDLTGGFRLICGAHPGPGDAGKPMVFWSAPFPAGARGLLAVEGSALTEEAMWAVAAPAGADSIVAALRGKENTLWRVDLRNGRPELIARFADPQIRWLEFAAL
ncbi:SIR2 family NAD-dependent protein deacylase [Paractinoplanes globisporus]|uniref:SIR2 family protein n=1 Tax=Paractinoplanes globisporus TaxID=113565 RepID=A0ABW6WT88_9ACTN|nr:SIR2 family protein [Actinoplanes globisporus]